MRVLVLFFLTFNVSGTLTAKTICINNECNVASEFQGVLNKKFETDRSLSRKPATKEDFLEKTINKISPRKTNRVVPETDLVLTNPHQGGYVDKSFLPITRANIILHQGELTVLEGKSSLVAGTIIDGKYKGSQITGIATLDAGSLTANIQITKVMVDGRGYGLSGILLDSSGNQHMKVKVNYNDTEALIVSSSIVGLGAVADNNVERDINRDGESVDKRTINNSLTKGVVGGLMNAADRYSERIKKGVATAKIDSNQVFKLIINSNVRAIN